MEMLYVHYHQPTECNFTNSLCHKGLHLRCWQGVPDPTLLCIHFELKNCNNFQGKQGLRWTTKTISETCNHSKISYRNLRKIYLQSYLSCLRIIKLFHFEQCFGRKKHFTKRYFPIFNRIETSLSVKFFSCAYS